MRKLLPAIIGISVIVLVASAYLLHSKNTFAAANHIVISQIQVSGDSANDEFVELYNPTPDPIDLTGWRLRRESSTGGSPSNLVSSLSGTIPAHGYYLIAFPGVYTGSTTPDEFYSATSSAIAANNTIRLYSDAGITEVDRVGMGVSENSETSPAPSLESGESIQRLLDDSNGHGQDTNDNSVDFELLKNSNPRNSSVIAPSPTFTPTPEPTEEPTPSPEPTAEPSAEPTAEPTPTTEPTAIPSPSATPTEEPTPTPTLEPSPTVEPTPTNSPKIFSSNPIITCTVNYKGIRVFGRTFYFPLVTCFRT